MAGHPSDKKFRSTFTTHHGAPVWILEEIEPTRPEAQAFKNEKLDDMVDQFLATNQPGASIQWDESEAQPEWKFCPPQDDGPTKLPEKITLMVEEKDEDFTTMPPIKYFTPEGLPVYYFADPVTGHKYWDVCDCDGCYNDNLEINYSLSPKQLKEPLTRGKQQKGKATRPNKKRRNKKARSAASSGAPTPP